MNIINCPQCKHEINIDEAIYSKVKNEFGKEYREVLDKERATLKKQKEDMDAVILDAVNMQSNAIEKNLLKQYEAEKKGRIAVLEKQINDSNSELAEFQKTKIEVEKLKRDNATIKEQVELESEKKISATLQVEREKIVKLESEKATLKISEKDFVINQLKDSLNEAQQKIEQGSMQIQGEILELAIEDYLKTTYILDTISEVKKGAKGADCLQTINTRTKNNCGSILYESKRTKTFQPAWIEKFKADLIENGASVGVLVTESLPDGITDIGNIKGVWVCSFNAMKGLVMVLRDSIVSVDNAVLANTGKGDKMEMLYSYLTSNEFNLRINAIVEGFVQMKTDLESEKRSMAGIWKKRDKQIEKVLLNTTSMHGSLVGIAGSGIQAVPLLELDDAKLLESKPTKKIKS